MYACPAYLSLHLNILHQVLNNNRQYCKERPTHFFYLLLLNWLAVNLHYCIYRSKCSDLTYPINYLSCVIRIIMYNNVHPVLILYFCNNYIRIHIASPMLTIAYVKVLVDQRVTQDRKDQREIIVKTR